MKLPIIIYKNPLNGDLFAEDMGIKKLDKYVLAIGLPTKEVEDSFQFRYDLTGTEKKLTRKEIIKFLTENNID